MALLFRYLRGYWPLVALALVLAAINQVFSLLDPLIFRHVIDDYATKHDQYTNGQFFRGVTLLLAMLTESFRPAAMAFFGEAVPTAQEGALSACAFHDW